MKPGVKRAVVIQPDSRPALVEGDFSSLAALQEVVGGYIESVRSPWPGSTVYVNEEGKIQGLPYNDAATRILADVLPDDVIVGPAIIVGATEDGYDCDVPDEVIDALHLDGPGPNVGSVFEPDHLLALRALRRARAASMMESVAGHSPRLALSVAEQMVEKMGVLYAETGFDREQCLILLGIEEALVTMIGTATGTIPALVVEVSE